MKRSQAEVVPGCSEVVPEEVVLVPSPLKGREGNGNKEHPRGQDLVPEQPRRNNLTAGRAEAGNVRGGSTDPARGGYCTPKWLADAVGEFDLDPFSNPRSHIAATHACWLERGDDGFGDQPPGSFRTCGKTQTARDSWKVWLQPPYERGFVARAFEHYVHTAWVALLRFDPRTAWFDAVYEAAELVAVIRSDPRGKPFGFEAPPGVKLSSLTFPHALYFRNAEDATPAALRHCAAWRKRRR